MRSSKTAISCGAIAAALIAAVVFELPPVRTFMSWSANVGPSTVSWLDRGDALQLRYAASDDYLLVLDVQKGANAWLTMGLTEGKNREIRRVLEHLGLEVSRLIRIAYGPFQLGNMARGQVEDVPARILREQMGGKPAKHKVLDVLMTFKDSEDQLMRNLVPELGLGREGWTSG